MPEALTGPADAPAFEARGVAKTYRTKGGSATQAIGDVSFTLGKGEFVAVVGPSGCGKTTLLRCLSGLLAPDDGAVRYQGAAVTGVVPGLSVVFQEYNRSLFPWLSVGRNVAFPLRKLPRDERAHRVAEALDQVGLAEVAGHYPWQLSGGMQQRAAIARALVSRPRCLLMDEPFASVDAQTRESLEDVTLEIWSRLDLSVLLVTHDIDEAIYMSDRVLVLSSRPSRVIGEVEVGLPRPRNQVETRALPEFQDHRRDIHRLIRQPAE
jgi:NitT/TauT family transport system ATP-binding protein